MHYDAYLCVTALLWEQVMCELRCRTNSREVGLNPYSLAHDHYEPLLHLAREPQSEDPFRIMNEDFNKGFPQNETAVRWKQERLSRMVSGDQDGRPPETYRQRRAKLWQVRQTSNWAEMEEPVKELLRIAGHAIEVSLGRNAAEWTGNGVYSKANASQGMLEEAKKVRSHNCLNETPFALGRYHFQTMPRLKDRANAGMTLAKLNGSLKSKPSPLKRQSTKGPRTGQAGSLWRADPAVRAAICTDVAFNGKASSQKRLRQEEKSRECSKKRKLAAAENKATQREEKRASDCLRYYYVATFRTSKELEEATQGQGSLAAKRKFLTEQVRARTDGWGLEYEGDISTSLYSKDSAEVTI